MKTCSVEGCNEPVHIHTAGLCKRHYTAAMYARNREARIEYQREYHRAKMNGTFTVTRVRRLRKGEKKCAKCGAIFEDTSRNGRKVYCDLVCKDAAAQGKTRAQLLGEREARSAKRQGRERRASVVVVRLTPRQLLRRPVEQVLRNWYRLEL